MSRRLIDCFYSILLAISIVAMVPIPSVASDPRFDHAIVPVTDFPASRSANPTGECCPVDWGLIHSGAASCGFNVTGGTHDSAPLHRIASLPKPQPLARVESMQSKVSIADAIMAMASVRVQQVVEPFAVVGPRLTPSSESITEFMDWCNQIAAPKPVDAISAIVDSSSNRSPVDQMISIDRMLESLAAEEPSCAEINHVEIRNYVENDRSPANESFISIAKLDPLVGSSAIIATLGSGPYADGLSDTAKDASGELKLWSVFPTVTRPFCIRHSSRNFAADHLSFAAALPVKAAGSVNKHLSTLGDFDSMLAEARSNVPVKNQPKTQPQVQIASHRAQADAIIASASTTIEMVQDIGAWMLEQQAAATDLAWKKAEAVARKASFARSVFNASATPASLQNLGARVANLAVAGQQFASTAAVRVAKAMPSQDKAAAQEKAAAQMAAAEADLDR